MFDVADDGQISLAVVGEQMPLDGLARAPRGPVDAPQPDLERPPIPAPLDGALALDFAKLAAPLQGSDG